MTPLSSPSPPPVPGFSGASGVVGVSPLLGSTLPLPCVMSSSSSSMTLPFLSTFCHETELANSSEYFGETQDKPKDGHYPRCDAKIRKKDLMKWPDDDEHLHQYRISVRVARSLVKFIKPYQKRLQNQTLKDVLKELQDPTSRMRELDVQVREAERHAALRDPLPDQLGDRLLGRARHPDLLPPVEMLADEVREHLQSRLLRRQRREISPP